MDGSPLPSRGVFRDMVLSLAHRGPDGEGIWEGSSILLGHRRLSILDLSEAGSQPMRRADCVLTYNGEIYNYEALRTELRARGASFISRSDTEVLLQAYRIWGLDAVHRLNGIFAFALWDEGRRRLWLCRDRLGVKPLYYSRQAGLLRFASETRAFTADPAFDRRVSRSAISSYLTFGYIPAPHSAWEAAQQLQAGHQVIVEDGQIRCDAYWALPRPPTSGSNSDQLLDQFQKKFASAVQSQTISDSEVAVLLSGGLDSAAIAGVARPLKNYCAAFSEADFDESPAAQETATLLGLPCQRVALSQNWEETAWKLSEHLDEPFADSSALALDQLSDRVSREVKVVLVGDGADELLGGYTTYQMGRAAGAWRTLPVWVKSHLQKLVHMGPVDLGRRYPWRQMFERFWLGAECGPGFDHACWRAHLFPQMRSLLCKPDWLPPWEPLDTYAHLAVDRVAGSSRVNALLRSDLLFYLPHDLLTKTDRICMRHGLEARVPFLDHHLVEFCLSLPDDQLWTWSAPTRRKRILRRFLLGLAGRSVARRPKKGFNVPVASLMRGPLHDPLLDLVRSQPFRSEGPLQVGAVEELARQHRLGGADWGYLLYNFFCLSSWWKNWTQSN